MVGDPDDPALSHEAEELRLLVRELSARLVSALALLPLEAALAVARGEDPAAKELLRLDGWRETIELTSVDVEAEMARLWKRVPRREPA